MKRILLSSAAVVAFAGAAYADGHTGVSFGGSADLEYNSNSGFSYGIDLAVTAAAELDNGLTATATFGLGMGTYYCYDDNSSAAPLLTYGYNVCFTDYELALTSDTAGLYFGDTASSADLHYSGVEGMAADGFNETGDAGESSVLRGEATFGSVTASISYGIDFGGRGIGDDLGAMQFAAVADLGSATVGLAFQANDDAGQDEIIGLFASTTLGGADLAAAYASNSATGEDSFGVDVSYPAGPVTIGAAYSSNSIADDYWELRVGYENGPAAVSAIYDSTDDWGIEGSYDVGNGLVVSAGIVDAGDDYYVAGAYDLGSDASFYASFVEDGGALNGDNEIGANDYARGTTVGISFAF